MVPLTDGPSSSPVISRLMEPAKPGLPAAKLPAAAVKQAEALVALAPAKARAGAFRRRDQRLAVDLHLALDLGAALDRIRTRYGAVFGGIAPDYSFAFRFLDVVEGYQFILQTFIK